MNGTGIGNEFVVNSRSFHFKVKVLDLFRGDKFVVSPVADKNTSFNRTSYGWRVRGQ